jgi:SPP1 family predicted phage head-tail adaptor
MLRAGSLNRLVTIKSLVVGQDAIGQPTSTWQDFAREWANIRHQTGLENIQADAQTSTAKASIRMRKRADVTAAMRVYLDATIYEIKAVLPDEWRRDRMDLSCERVS